MGDILSTSRSTWRLVHYRCKEGAEVAAAPTETGDLEKALFG
jgi:hypothetical protein